MCSKFIYWSLINMFFFFFPQVRCNQPSPIQPGCQGVGQSPDAARAQEAAPGVRTAPAPVAHRGCKFGAQKKTAAESAKGFWGGGVKDIDGV